MTAKKDIGIDLVETLSKISLILKTAMLIKDQSIAYKWVAFAQDLAERAAIAGED